MERMRQEETRKAQEEADLLAREKAREDRMRERQERLMARENAVRMRLEDEVKLKEKAERDRERRKRRRDGEQVESSSDDEAGNGTATPIKTNASTPGSSTQNSSWELRCEVCLQTGWNLVSVDVFDDSSQSQKDEADTVCCDDCGRWQHVTCHDRRDIAEGRGIRDWEKVDFRVGLSHPEQNDMLTHFSARSARSERWQSGGESRNRRCPPPRRRPLPLPTAAIRLRCRRRKVWPQPKVVLPPTTLRLTSCQRCRPVLRIPQSTTLCSLLLRDSRKPHRADLPNCRLQTEPRATTFAHTITTAGRRSPRLGTILSPRTTPGGTTLIRHRLRHTRIRTAGPRVNSTLIDQPNTHLAPPILSHTTRLVPPILSGSGLC